MLREISFTAIAALSIATNGLAADCFKETGTYTGEGTKTSNVDPIEDYALQVELSANSYTYTRTFKDGTRETGTHSFVCNADGTMEWTTVENGEGEWEEGGSYDVEGKLENGQTSMTLMVRFNRLFFLTTNEDEGVVERFGDRATKN
ncbi:MAG: hypothetical protein AB7T49_07110 [Oligoflexales bacterium]